MPTSIYKFDGTHFLTIKDYTTDSTTTTLTLPGKGIRDYGATIAQDLLWTMQNFAGRVSPRHNTTGQCWFDTNINALRVFNGTSWDSDNGTQVSTSMPESGISQGAMWYDSTNLQLNVWNGSNWDIIAPLGSAVNNDPISNTSIPTNSKIDAVQITDSLANNHQAFRMTIGGYLTAIISKDDQYTPNPSINGFATISPGININSNLITNIDDLTIFRSTKTNVPDSDNKRNLGTPSIRFNSIYANTAILSGQVSAGAATSNNPFTVTGPIVFNGNSNFTGGVNFNAGTTNIPPLVTQPGTLSTTPVLGGFEFDGSNYYISTNVGGVTTRETIAIGTVVSPATWRWIFTSGGNANSIIATCTPEPQLPIINGSIITGVIPATNTSTTVTIKVGNAPSGNILLADGITNPPIGCLVFGHVVQFKWNGFNWLAIDDLTATGTIGFNSAYLPLAGGAMTGLPVLPADPTLSLQAVTKQYIDNAEQVLDAEIAALNAKIGALNLNNYLQLGGGNLSGPISLASDPTQALQASTKNYVDQKVSTVNLNNYLPLIGGTMTGPIVLPGDPTQNLQTADKNYVDNAISNAAGKAKDYAMGNPVWFKSSGTYTSGPGVTKLLVIATAGGAGGSTSAGGGGAGATVISYVSTALTNANVTVGVGGTVGNAGGKSQFAFSNTVNILSVSGTTGSSQGGQGGLGSISGANVPTALTIYVNGNSGGGPLLPIGGTSFWGGGPTSTGSSGTAYGTGGAQGGAGAPGVVLVIEFK